MGSLFYFLYLPCISAPSPSGRGLGVRDIAVLFAETMMHL